MIKMVKCNFCNEYIKEKEFAIQAGPRLHICSECLDICIEIKAEYEKERKEKNANATNQTK